MKPVLRLKKKSQLSRGGRRSHDRMVVGFTTTCAISAYHPNILSSNATHGEAYLIQHYVIKFVKSMVFTGYSVSSTNKTDRHDIIEILLKKVLNTIPPKVNYYLIESLVFKKSVCTCYKCTASLVCMMWYKNVINNNIIQFI